MRFTDLRRELELHGWCCAAETLTSPSGGFWFDRATIERDVLAVYIPAARRAHSFAGAPRDHELSTLLDVLGGDPAVVGLAEHVASLQAELAWLAPRHGMALSQWTLGYPSVRATALHPTGGIAVIECATEGPPGFDLYAYHWIDDYSESVRLSRRKSFSRLSGSAALRQTAESAVAFLRSPAEDSAFERSSIGPANEGGIAIEREYQDSLLVLR